VVRRQRSLGSAAAGKLCAEGFAIIMYPRGLFVSGNGDDALPYRYPISTCPPNIRECESGSSERLALETRVLDGRVIGGRRVRPLAVF
jgi:hypothetical protein